MRKMALLAGSFPIVFAAGIAHGSPVVVTISEGVAEPLATQGTGLCQASAISLNPITDFGLNNPSAFLNTVNAFIEAHQADRVESTLGTLFDLSNNNAANLQQSYGDFVDAVLPTCKTGGCDFFVNDTATSFASRFRGFFNVTADLANKPVHFGFYSDDAVGLVLYDKALAAHEVVVRPAATGFPVYRVTNEVRFTKPGLYPIEVLYLEIGEHAALELSYFVGDFTDFERPANQPPIIKLKDAGFTLFSPAAFFQSVTGQPAFPDLQACQQCDRAFVNMPGQNGCTKGYYCNEAALCAPCDSDKFCGPMCAPCGGNTPFCEIVNATQQCVACRTDADCSSGGTCNPETKTCNGDAGGNGGSGGAGGGGGNGGSGGNANPPSESGCECRAVSGSSNTGIPAMIGLAFAGVGVMRRWRKRARMSR